MAKAFDDNERKLIKDKLKEGALLFIQQQGVRKTSVDELVKYANISKGAFYLFYTSKELLFFFFFKKTTLTTYMVLSPLV